MNCLKAVLVPRRRSAWASLRVAAACAALRRSSSVLAPSVARARPAARPAERAAKRDASVAPLRWHRGESIPWRAASSGVSCRDAAARCAAAAAAFCTRALLAPAWAAASAAAQPAASAAKVAESWCRAVENA
eukprot:Skav234460  [mRNA]  locus=scaffold1647:170553:171107:- [translate_table: standard]